MERSHDKISHYHSAFRGRQNISNYPPAQAFSRSSHFLCLQQPARGARMRLMALIITSCRWKNFSRRSKNNEFIEWEMVYEGKYYGTLNSELERIWDDGKGAGAGY